MRILLLNQCFYPDVVSTAQHLTDLATALSARRAGQLQSARQQLVQVNDDYERLAFARFLAGKGKGAECVEQVRLLGMPLSEQNRRELVRVSDSGERVVKDEL